MTSVSSVPILSLVAIASMAVIWIGGSLLESASEELATHYGLPPVVRGTVLAAFGSSSPELCRRVRLGAGDAGLPWGVIVVAAVTSLPDAVFSVKAARSGEGVTSIANVLGSNTFDLLVAIPTGVLLAGTAEINFAATVPLMGFLVLATLALLTVLRTDLELSNVESVDLLFVYTVFLLWMLAETLGRLAFVPR